MFKPVKKYISDKYTDEDYRKLKFRLNSPDDIWKEAIEIFEDRIETRYFFVLEKLMEDKSIHQMRKLGCAIVTLQCSLIDTFSKFRYGSNKEKNEKRFTNFLKEYFIFGEKSEELAKKVYKDIRCGLVHSGSTENMCGISAELTQLVSILPNGAISLDVIILQEKLTKYYNEYKKKLMDKEKEELRKNFVYIMNKVCKV